MNLTRSTFILICLIYYTLNLTGCAMLGLDGLAGFGSSNPSDTGDAHSANERIERAMKEQQITLGMRMHEVRYLWGTPQEVETAGDPSMGNQRWVYYTGLSSKWSLGSSRVIYFEEGRVAGWESAHR